MNQWLFVISAYGVTALLVVGLVGWAWLSMRKAEKRVER